jgi:hypothetical protein
VFWTAGFVLLTLLLQAPALPFVLRLTKLNLLPPNHQERRRRAVEALNAHTEESIANLMDDEDELMAGEPRGVWCNPGSDDGVTQGRALWGVRRRGDLVLTILQKHVLPPAATRPHTPHHGKGAALSNNTWTDCSR